jgi:hypothetical protein
MSDHMATVAAIEDFRLWLQRTIDGLVAANLADPDLSGRDQSFKDGYVKGFREGVAAFLLYKADEMKRRATSTP